MNNQSKKHSISIVGKIVKDALSVSGGSYQMERLFGKANIKKIKDVWKKAAN